MRIISNFKDYYDFSGFSVHDGDYRETVYLRKTELKVTGLYWNPPKSAFPTETESYLNGGRKKSVFIA